MKDRHTAGLVRLFAAALLAVVACSGAQAWACVPQPLVSLKPQGSGPAGSEVTVSAIAVNGDAEIRWNGSDGPLLATAAGPAFSALVKVPPADPGLYTIILVERTKTGSLGSSARASFLVTPGGPTSAAVPPPARAEPPVQAPVAPKAGGDGVAPALAVAGGVILLAFGGLSGAFLAGRRARSTDGRHVGGLSRR